MGAEEYENEVRDQEELPQNNRPYRENRALIYTVNPDKRDDQRPVDSVLNITTEYPNDEKKKLAKIGDIKDFNPSLSGWIKFYDKYENKKEKEFFKCPIDENLLQNQNIFVNKDPSRLEFYQGSALLIGGNLIKHGFGVFTKGGSYQIGTWRDDKLSGWCIESQPNGRYIEAKFEEGKPKDYGIIVEANGETYEGSFKGDPIREPNKWIKTGKGKLETNLIRYEGDFKDDKFDGEGEIEFKNSKFKYEGQFENDKIVPQVNKKWKLYIDNNNVLDNFSDSSDVEIYENFFYKKENEEVKKRFDFKLIRKVLSENEKNRIQEELNKKEDKGSESEEKDEQNENQEDKDLEKHGIPFSNGENSRISQSISLKNSQDNQPYNQRNNDIYRSNNFNNNSNNYNYNNNKNNNNYHDSYNKNF